MYWRKFLSRKFLMALVGATLLITNEGLGLNLPRDETLAVAAVIISYIVIEGTADAIRGK